MKASRQRPKWGQMGRQTDRQAGRQPVLAARRQQLLKDGRTQLLPLRALESRQQQGASETGDLCCHHRQDKGEKKNRLSKTSSSVYLLVLHVMLLYYYYGASQQRTNSSFPSESPFFICRVPPTPGQGERTLVTGQKRKDHKKTLPKSDQTVCMSVSKKCLIKCDKSPSIRKKNIISKVDRPNKLNDLPWLTSCMLAGWLPVFIFALFI